MEPVECEDYANSLACVNRVMGIGLSITLGSFFLLDYGTYNEAAIVYKA